MANEERGEVDCECLPEWVGAAAWFSERSFIVYVFKINHKVIFDYLFKSSYMPV